MIKGRLSLQDVAKYINNMIAKVTEYQDVTLGKKNAALKDLNLVSKF